MGILIFFLVIGTLGGCRSGEGSKQESKQNDQEVVIKRRDDGTKSSASTLDENGYVHGVMVNYYEDGKTIHSRITYVHGTKEGPAVWYYKNGQMHEHTNFEGGKKHGPTKRYYENGNLMEELTYEMGEVVPGSEQKYSVSGTPVTD